MNFWTEEMIYALGVSDKKYWLNQRLYHERYPITRQHSTKPFQRLREIFGASGNMKYENVERTKIALSKKSIFLTVTENPHLSVRELPEENEVIFKSSVHRMLRENKLHPYHI